MQNTGISDPSVADKKTVGETIQSLLPGNKQAEQNKRDQEEEKKANKPKPQQQDTFWDEVKRAIRLVFFLAVYIFSAAYYIYSLQVESVTSTEKLTIYTLAAVFPVSAFTYYEFRRPMHRARVLEDLKALTLDSLLDNEVEKIRPEELEDKATEHSKATIAVLYPRIYSGWHYVLLSTIVFLISIIGLTLFFIPSSKVLSSFTDDPTRLATVVEALRYGFLGAYIYAIQLIYRRYTTLDLQPSVYLSAALNMVAGMAFNIVAFLAIINLDTSSSVQGLSAIIAFSLGYFPNLAIRWFNVLAFQALGINSREANRLPLKLIDGVSIWHETRLNDNGIDNVQNLASAKVTDLLLHTPFSVEEIVDWIDQAILYLYLSDETIISFRQVGVRTLSDFQTQWKEYYNQRNPSTDNKKKEETDKKRNEAALLFQSTPERLDMLYRAVQEGPNVHNIANYWSNKKLISDAKRERRIQKLFTIKGKLQQFKEQVIPKILTEIADMEAANDPLPIQEILKQIIKVHSKEFEPVENLVIRSLEDKLSFAEYHYFIADFKAARNIYIDVLKRDKTLAEAQNGLARLALAENHPKEAIPHAEKAVKLAKENPKRYSSVEEFQYYDTLTNAYIADGKDIKKAGYSLARMSALCEEIEKDTDARELADSFVALRKKGYDNLVKTPDGKGIPKT